MPGSLEEGRCCNPRLRRGCYYRFRSLVSEEATTSPRKSVERGPRIEIRDWLYIVIHLSGKAAVHQHFGEISSSSPTCYFEIENLLGV